MKKFIKRAKMLMVFLLFFIGVSAQNIEFNFNATCIQAAKQISLLKLKSATLILNQEKINHPNNCAVDYLENYIDFYTLITNQDITELHALEGRKSTRIARFQKLPNTSPYKLYAQAEINIQWAFSRVFHQEYFTAALEFRDSYKLLEQNREAFPFFAMNYKDIGMLKAMFGTVPENFHWVLNVVGLKGDFKEGMELLMNFIVNQSYTPDQLLEKQSAQYYYSLLQLNFGDKQAAWTFCESYTREFQTNLLSNYLRAFIGIKTAHNEDALEALSLKPTLPEYAPFPILEYLNGVAYLNKLSENCTIHLKRFVTFSKGKNLIKDTYKRLSWYYLINGDKDKFHIYQNMIIKYGSAVAEEDKVALKEAQLKFIPNVSILKARLLFDGGYFDKALVEIQQAVPVNLTEQMELEYRLGRILQEQKQFVKAIEHFEKCIQISVSSSHLYYAPGSCNQLASIYERLGNRTQARFYYEKTLTYKNYDYKNSISLKAKSGIQRLSE